MRTKRRVLAGKIELTEGVAETLTAAEGGIIAIDTKWTPDIKMLERSANLPTLSKLKKLPGMALAHIGFKAELMGRGTAFAANNLPLVDPYLKACGFARTLDITPGSEKVIYKPASDGIPCMTMGMFDDGVLKIIAGARGAVKFSGSVGEQLWVEFDFMGVYIPVTDTAIIAPAYLGIDPPRLLGANLKIDAFAPTLKSFNIDMGNKLAPREDLNSASGYKSFMLTDRDPGGSFDPEMELVATHDWYGRWKSGTSGALSIGAFGTTQYNKVKITAPSLVYTKVAEGDREGLELANTDFQLAMGTGDDELVIEFS